MKTPNIDSLQDIICNKVYKEIEIPMADLISAMSVSLRTSHIVVSINSLLSNGTLIISADKIVSLHGDVRKHYDNIRFDNPSDGPIVPGRTLNKMNLSTYKPPKYEERRIGSMDFKSWKSTGGD